MEPIKVRGCPLDPHQQYLGRDRKHAMKIKRLTWAFVICSLICVGLLLTSCSSMNSYDAYRAMRRVESIDRELKKPNGPNLRNLDRHGWETWGDYKRSQDNFTKKYNLK